MVKPRGVNGNGATYENLVSAMYAGLWAEGRQKENICSIRQTVRTLHKSLTPECGGRDTHEKRAVNENTTQRLTILLHISGLKRPVPLPLSLAHIASCTH